MLMDRVTGAELLASIAICKNNASFTLVMRLNHICATNLQTGTCPFYLMITVNTCPLGEGGQPKGQEMDPPRKGGTCEVEDFEGMFILHSDSNHYGNPSCGFAARRLA